MVHVQRLGGTNDPSGSLFEVKAGTPAMMMDSTTVQKEAIDEFNYCGTRSRYVGTL